MINFTLTYSISLIRIKYYLYDNKVEHFYAWFSHHCSLKITLFTTYSDGNPLWFCLVKADDPTSPLNVCTDSTNLQQIIQRNTEF